jgi:UDP:flavonoid glycosyltransferase YjiC (YdhE family)
MVGAQSIEQPEQIGGVFFTPFVPANALLPHCDWTICHGGQNTIIQSLRYGTPLLIFPGAIFERRDNAQQVAATGAGHMGEVTDFTPGWLHDKLATRERCAAAAAQLGAQIEAGGGAAEAVKCIEQHSTS